MDPGLEAVVEAARTGDREAFGSLVEHDSRFIYAVAFGILGSHDDALDAIQESALKAWLQLPGLRDPAAWHGWFRRITVRVALDHARKAARRSVHSIRVDEEGAQENPTRISDAHLDILESLGRLREGDQTVLRLRFGADLPVPEIAEVLGIPLGSAKARLHRAVKRLRAELERDDERSGS
jgi:RNA polymerase sigma-70 factor (ECF subfamily)